MAKQNKFGTFGGVFVPSILTILGVIMYLRLPTIVGEAGLWATLGIIVIAHVISITTGLSVSSIATDKKVEAGGTYYMISRSLGLPIGGTLGIALFIGLSFSVSLYLIGFSEIILSSGGWEITKNNIRICGSLALLAITILTFISTSLAIKSQYFILALIILSLVSIVWGMSDHKWVAVAPTLTMNPDSKLSLMVLFGIFFPAVTGFEAGVSMSGDLKDPKKSIPGGSIMSIVVGFIVYVGLAFFLAYTVDGSFLRNGNGAIQIVEISKFTYLVVWGIAGATLSSALGSILGAPRILQATAVDNITHSFFSKGSGKTNEPRNALLLTFIIAELGILIGELDVIARVVSIFFITTYGFLNISAAFEKWTSADFRPEFKVSGWISVIGALACIIVMIQLDLVAMIAAIALLGALFFYLKNKELKLESGDAWSGVWASLVKTGLTRLTRNKLHNRNWRPNIIMFSGNPNTRKYMIQIGKAVSGNLGILSAFELVEGGTKILARTSSNLNEENDTIGYFHYKFTCKDVYTGMDSISRIYGFSGVEPNTILMGWSRNPRNKEQFIDLLKGFDQSGYSSIFLDYDVDKKFGSQKQIDIWWSGKDKNLAFAVNIIQHFAKSEIWDARTIRLMIINPINSEAESVYRAASTLVNNFRIEAEVRVINNEIEPQSRKQIIHEESANSDLIILGISDSEYRNLGDHYDDISDTLDGICSTLVINASSVFEEYEVISDLKKAVLDNHIPSRTIEMPALKLSSYKEIATDIAKLEKNGEKVLELFYRKTFAQLSKDHTEIISELLKRVVAAKKELIKINELPEHIRRMKAIDKLKNEAFFKVNILLKEKLSGDALKIHEEKISEGLNWYVDRLKTELKKFPLKLKINYQEEDFEIEKDDRFGLKTTKFFKQLKHKIVGKPINQSIKYRSHAKHFLYHNRLKFINGFLDKYLEQEVNFFDEIRSITNGFFNAIDNLEKKINDNTVDWFNLSVLEGLEGTIADFQQIKRDLEVQWQNRIQLEYSQNLQEMNDELSKVDADHFIAGTAKNNKVFKTIETEILEFPELYGTKVQTTLNLILIELSVNATRNRMEAIQDSFLRELELTVERKYLKEITVLSLQLETEKRVPEQAKAVIGHDIQTQIKETFTGTIVRMLPLIEEMPENLEIYSAVNQQENDLAVEIPVARMMEHYFKSSYQIPLEEEFEKLLEGLKRTAYSARDIINLTEVNLENNTAEKENVQIDEYIAEAIRKLNLESKYVKDLVQEFIKNSKEKFQEVFDPLSGVKIEESAEEFSSGLRAYQGQQVMTGLNKTFLTIKKTFQRAISSLFYSRSKGILFTKKIKTPIGLKSTVSRALDVREQVKPDKSILSTLPHYYTTLFNGKSSVGRDFWIKREIEEERFKNAVKRYKEGYRGGILILGERNSGKTAFSRQMTLTSFKNQHVYTVFPSPAGGAEISDFDNALEKATQKRGSSAQILGRLPEGSTVVINDLELFWRKTDSGNEVVHLLCDLIDQFSDKILFIVNMNPFAYQLIDQINQLNQYFIEVITMLPFRAEELKDLIITRHRSSGFGIRNESNQNLSEIQLAQLFNRYFDYSLGIPGTALGGWLANIKKLSSGNLIIEKPETVSLDVFKHLSEDWKMLLIQFILHKRMSKETINEVSDISEKELDSILLALIRAGIVDENGGGAYFIDPFLHPFITESFKEQGLL